MLARLVTLILKELQLTLNDPQGRRMLILPVLLQLALFPFAISLEVKNATLAILNHDQGAQSVELIERFARAAAFPHLLMLQSQADVTRVIDDQEALLALEFPSDFSRGLASGKSATIEAIVDGRRSNSAQIAFGYAQSIVGDYTIERARARGAPPPSRIVVRNWFNPNLEYRWFLLPSLVAVITTIGTLMMTALSVAREREQGTFEQLLVSPLTPGMIMVGKTIPALIVAGIQATLIVTASVLIYGVPLHGSVLLLYFGLLCYALSLSGFGLVISSICQTQQQAFLGVFSFLMPAMLLSGFIGPVENMPPILQWISWIDPLRHFIVIVKGLFLKGYDWSLVWPELWPLGLISAGGFVTAYWVFKRRVA
jgi:drug efflux transport system permease protein